MTIKIKDARDLGKREDAQAIVILCVNKSGTIDGVSYGETAFKCQAIGAWLDTLIDHGLSRIPFETVFGWGNDGSPKKLGKTERKKLLQDWGVLG